METRNNGVGMWTWTSSHAIIGGKAPINGTIDT